MARFLFVLWAGGGNVNPVVAMATALHAHGHDVHVMGPPELSDRFERGGVPFLSRDPAREWDLHATADDVIAAAGEVDPDALVIDYMQTGALCGAEATGLPTASYVHTLYKATFVDGDLITMYMIATLDAVAAVRERLRLPPIERMADLVHQRDVVLVTAPSELDFGDAPLPPNLVYVGPVLEGSPPSAADRSRRVVVSLGTTDMGEQPLLEKVLAAAADLPVRVHATVGHGGIDAAAIATPDNAVVTGYVPHADVLPGAALLVCHGGLGGILAAMTYGVPILAIPLGRDQPANAAAVERVGVGGTVTPDADVADIRAAISALVENGAVDLSAAMRAYGERWREVLETLASSRRR